jgi:type IV pilus assembly protein PilC
MPVYAWQARDTGGRTQRGTREARDEPTLVAELRALGMLPLRVEPRTDARASVQDDAGPSWIEHLAPPRSSEVELGLQQIATMLRSGLPLLQTLEICADQCPRRSMARVWRGVAAEIRAGGGLSEAFARRRCIPPLVVTLTAVGERTGELDLVLTRSAALMQRRRELRASVVTALAYPALVVVLTIAVVVYLMVGLIPKLSTFLSGFGRRLPPITQLLVDVSNAVSAWFVPGMIALVGLVLALAVVWRWPPGRLALERLLLRLPVVGRILHLAATTAFARNLSLMLSSGVRLTDALQVVEPVIGNRWLGRKVAGVRREVVQGAGFAAPLAATRAFPPMLNQMAMVGEASGTLDDVLEHVAEHHDQRLQTLIRRLGAVIEPVLVVVLGGIVGFIYLAFFVAVYSIVGGRT